jgi:hypothetical protein
VGHLSVLFRDRPYSGDLDGVMLATAVRDMAASLRSVPPAPARLDLNTIHDALVSSGLTGSRGALLAGIPRAFVSSLPKNMPDEWFKQFAGEARADRNGPAGKETRWTPLRKRIEAWDCAVYVVWLETHLDLARKPAKFWDALENLVQPAILDLFSAPQETESKAPELQKAVPANANPAAAPAPPQKKSPWQRLLSMPIP